MFLAFFLECWTPKDGTDRLSRNVGNYLPALRNIPKVRRSHSTRDINMKSGAIASICVHLLFGLQKCFLKRVSREILEYINIYKYREKFEISFEI
jgi:hypothetical protein